MRTGVKRYCYEREKFTACRGLNPVGAAQSIWLLKTGFKVRKLTVGEIRLVFTQDWKFLSGRYLDIGCEGWRFGPSINFLTQNYMQRFRCTRA